MTVAHVEALRLENHFLKQSLFEKKSDEKEVGEIQKKYHQVLDLTEVSLIHVVPLFCYFVTLSFIILC